MQLLSHKAEDIPSLKYTTVITIQCDHCTSLFQRSAQTVQINLNRGSKHMYCSRHCSFEGCKEHLHPLKCEQCGKDYLGLIGKKFPHNFCGQTCRKKYQRIAAAATRPPRVCNKKASPPSKVEVNTTFAIQPIEHRLEDIPVEGKIFACSKCGTEILRKRKDVRSSKTGHFYCSKSCRMQHYNANVLTRSSRQRSRAEDMMIALIAKDFPTLEIRPNDRLLLPSKLEIDIYLPSVRLAIELNGPVHYMPIYGEERFDRVQSKDAQKALEIHEKGVGLLVLDSSKLNSAKKQRIAIDQYYLEHVKPLIENGARAALASASKSL